MKRVNFIATILFVLAFALPLFAQTTPAPSTTKICFINTAAFMDEKDGIKKLLTAVIALDKEFEPRRQELVNMNTRGETLAKEIQALQTQLNNAATAKPAVVNVDKVRNDILAKQEEGSRLEIDFKRKQEDAKTAFEKREELMLSPIRREIFIAVTDYAKAKGYDLVLDGANLERTGSLLFVNQGMDLTADFIKFFNAKPATTASTAAPK